MVAFLASSIPLLTIQIDYVIQYTKTNIPKVPASAYVSGYIILVIVQYMWILVIGSDDQTWLGQLGYHLPAFEPTNSYYSEKMDQSLPSSAIMRPLRKCAYFSWKNRVLRHTQIQLEKHRSNSMKRCKRFMHVNFHFLVQK